MRNDTPLTVIGNLTKDPELRFTPSGAAVVRFTVASTPRTFDRQAGEWKDGEATFLDVTAWQSLAENVAETFHKGDRVIVAGTLHTERWNDKDSGEPKSVIRLRADEVGASVAYATARITKTSRRAGSGEPDVDPVTGEAATLRERPVPANAGE